ncbi:hypothetical protein ABW20_dc0105853 [Dactylellina cionopaga]|nr:hypothetical protein ABW20_dc0105853 [Dactylellina cionopaga]
MVLSSATLTKSLRDKSKPLLELLPTAQSICRSEVSIYFPGKEEWLVEWLVERLEDEASLDGRLSPETWDTLLELLKTPNLNLTAASATLRKHKFVGIIAKTLSDAVVRYQGDDGSSLQNSHENEDVDMQDAASSTSSSATEPGSPLVRITFGSKKQRQIKRDGTRRSRQVQALLDAVFRSVELLKTRFETGLSRDIENPKRRKLDLTTPIFKISPEVAGALCESYFKLLYFVVQGLGECENISKWTYLCQLLWKSCSYGVSDNSKVTRILPAIEIYYADTNDI